LKNSDEILSADKYEHFMLAKQTQKQSTVFFWNSAGILLEFCWNSAGILLEFCWNSSGFLAGSNQIRIFLHTLQQNF